MGKGANQALWISIIALAVVLPLWIATGAECACTPEEVSENKCFTTYSGYEFRVVESGPCGPVTGSISGFPHVLGNGDKLWCYEVRTPAAKVGTLNQMNLQIPLSFYDLSGAVGIPLLVPSSLYSQFAFNRINGCQGDSTSGFEAGDITNCGMKWTVRLNPTGQISRFYFASPAAIATAVEPKIMAPKIGSSLEPGSILGARALLDAPPFTPQAAYLCQEIDGKYYRFAIDDYGCPAGAILDCGSDVNVKCSQPEETCVEMPSVPFKMGIYRKDVNGNPDPDQPIMEMKTLREIGDLFGNRFCPAGHMRMTGSSCTTYYYGGRLYKVPAACSP